MPNMNSMRMLAKGCRKFTEYDGIVSPAYTVLVPTEEANSTRFLYVTMLRKNRIYGSLSKMVPRAYVRYLELAVKYPAW